MGWTDDEARTLDCHLTIGPGAAARKCAGSGCTAWEWRGRKHVDRRVFKPNGVDTAHWEAAKAFVDERADHDELWEEQFPPIERAEQRPVIVFKLGDRTGTCVKLGKL